ncbi:MAG: hypothetical protein JSV92_01345 [archaeon]|nr:MAG: hypothetical protein JSV92_01345 [archaeon]
MRKRMEEAKKKADVIVEEMLLSNKLKEVAYEILNLNKGRVRSKPDSLGAAAIYLASKYTGETTNGSGDKITQRELGLYSGVPQKNISYNSRRLSENCNMEVFS